jgi:hypothetical protein
MTSRSIAFAICATLVCGPGLTTKLSADAASTFTVPIVNVQFNPSTCSTVTATTATMNGLYRFVVTTTRNPDGTYTTRIQSEAHGTAVDNNGVQYVFNYNNHEQDVHSSPEDAPPFLGVVTDRFGLTSKGSAPNLKVSFQEAFSIDADGNGTLLSGVFKGDPNCDPI